MDPSYGSSEGQDSGVPPLEWSQPWDAFIAEVNQAVPPFPCDANDRPIANTGISPLGSQQDVHMSGVVDWLHESTTFRQPMSPQTWHHQNAQMPVAIVGQQSNFSEAFAEVPPKATNAVFPASRMHPAVFQESVSSGTVGMGSSRASSLPSTHEDYLSVTDTPDQLSTGGSNPASPKAAVFQCQLCPKTFTRALNLRQHLRGHSNERPFVCKICDRSFARAQDRKRHEVFHFETPSESPVMSRQGSMASVQSAGSASSSTAGKRGLRIPGGYTCTQCNRAFDVPSDLAQHERNHKPKGERPHACPECDERFLYPKDLGRHIRRKHPESLHASASNLGKGRSAGSSTKNGKATGSDTEELPSFESIERVNHYSPSVASSHRTQLSPGSQYQNADDPLESLAEVITGIPPGLRNMLFASMQGSEQELKVRLAQVWLAGIEVLLKSHALSDEQSQRTTQALEQLACDLNRLEMQDDGNESNSNT